MSIDWIELYGAVTNKRLTKPILTECRYNFERIYHIVDSQTVHVMVWKETYGFNNFAATRVGEIQEGANLTDWFWIPGEHNIADWLTHGKSPKDIGIDSIWQKGPKFLQRPESDWPISQYITEQPLPDTIKQGTVNITTQQKGNDSIATRIDIHKYSSYKKLFRITARVLAMYKKYPKVSFKNTTVPLLPDDVLNAEKFWMLQKQQEW